MTILKINCPVCGQAAEIQWRENYPKGSTQYCYVYHCWDCDYDGQLTTEETEDEIKVIEDRRFFFG